MFVHRESGQHACDGFGPRVPYGLELDLFDELMHEAAFGLEEPFHVRGAFVRIEPGFTFCAVGKGAFVVVSAGHDTVRCFLARFTMVWARTCERFFLGRTMRRVFRSRSLSMFSKKCGVTGAKGVKPKEVLNAGKGEAIVRQLYDYVSSECFHLYKVAKGGMMCKHFMIWYS